VSGRGRFAADKELNTRMVLTMFLLGLLYVVAIAALIAVGVNWLPVLLVVGIFFIFQFVASDRIALYSMKARVVTPQQAPALHGIVDRLCALSDVDKPRVAVADTDVPNAFATGRSQKKAVVCVTTGLLRRLEPDELEAVLAHELSHVAHRDVAVMTIAGFLGVLAGFITRIVLQSMMFGGYGSFGGGGGRQRSSNNDNNGGIPIVLAIIAVSAIVYAVSFVLIRTLSRYRELSADRTAALLTGRPSTLASALVKISGQMAQIPTRDLRAAEPFNAFFFTPAIAKGFSLSSLFATHPPLEQRLAQLQRISASMT